MSTRPNRSIARAYFMCLVVAITVIALCVLAVIGMSATNIG